MVDALHDEPLERDLGWAAGRPRGAGRVQTARPVLLVATQGFPFSVLLARSLRATGAAVIAACRPGDLLMQTSAVQAVHALRAPWTRSMHRALHQEPSAFLVPCDDAAVRLLLRVRRAECCRPRVDEAFGRAPADVLLSRSRQVEVARAAGVPVPEGVVVRGGRAARRALAALGPRVVVKVDGSTGGKGTVVVDSPAALRAAVAAAGRVHLRGLARAVRRGDEDGVREWRRAGKAVSVQREVAGRPATAAALCRDGDVLACAAVEVLVARPAVGPAAVVRALDHPQLLRSVAAVVRSLRLSGLHGFDFVLERESGRALFLEVNPRATPIAGLPLPGGDIVARLTAELGHAPRVRPAVARGARIALGLSPPPDVRERSDVDQIPWDEPRLLGGSEGGRRGRRVAR